MSLDGAIKVVDTVAVTLEGWGGRIQGAVGVDPSKVSKAVKIASAVVAIAALALVSYFLITTIVPALIVGAALLAAGLFIGHESYHMVMNKQEMEDTSLLEIFSKNESIEALTRGTLTPSLWGWIFARIHTVHQFAGGEQFPS